MRQSCTLCTNVAGLLFLPDDSSWDPTVEWMIHSHSLMSSLIASRSVLDGGCTRTASQSALINNGLVVYLWGMGQTSWLAFLV
jgi:hypothetical protein